MTQSFKHYPVESKTYAYKVGLAGDLPEGEVDRLETVMQKSKFKNEQRQEDSYRKDLLDFLNLQNTRATYSDIETEYHNTQF